MSEDKKLSADEIREQLGYRLPRRSQPAPEQMPRIVQDEVRTVSNGKVIAEFDGFLSSVRRFDVLHKRNVAVQLEQALARVKPTQTTTSK